MIKSFPGSHHNLVSTVDGLFSWGFNPFGQLGIANNLGQNIPQKIESINNSNDPILIGCGYGHSIISTNEAIFSFGENKYGQLGQGHNKNQNKPSRIEFSNQQVISISCGVHHSMILTHDDGIFSWGWNKYGQLGLGHNLDENKPQKITISQKEVTSISCGYHYSMILTNDGILSWGRNECGQLGLGHNKDQNSPQKIEISSCEVRSIVCGGNHSMVLTMDGSLFSWGSNSKGQLGLGHNDPQNKPSKISNELGEIVSIGGGSKYSTMMTNDGIFSWGSNYKGQLGLGHEKDENKPQRMKWNNIDKIISIYCCSDHLIILSSEGIFSCGWNLYGQLGQGHNDDQNIPSKVKIDSIPKGVSKRRLEMKKKQEEEKRKHSIEMEEMKTEVNEMKKKHLIEMEEMKTEVNEMKKKHSIEMEEMKTEVNEMKKKHSIEMEEIKQNHSMEIRSILETLERHESAILILAKPIIHPTNQ